MATLTLDEIAGRLAAALLVAAIFGVNRNLQHRAAGVRTLTLVALATCGLVLGIIESTHNNADAMTRTIQGIVSGIGFIGAGVILHRDSSTHVEGLTTAAMVWFVAALGILAGLGQLVLMGLISGFGFVGLLLGRPLERWFYGLLRGPK
jgi:putative Mg2+ transporter-C (MgtC) family protein